MLFVVGEGSGRAFYVRFVDDGAIIIKSRVGEMTEARITANAAGMHARKHHGLDMFIRLVVGHDGVGGCFLVMKGRGVTKQIW